MRQPDERVYNRAYRGHEMIITGGNGQWELHWNSYLFWTRSFAGGITPYPSFEAALAAGKNTIDELLRVHSTPRTISVTGFRSIRDLRQFKLSELNVMVGANGAGKSNFVDFFRLLHAMSCNNLARFVYENGKADPFLFGGPRVTSGITAHLQFGGPVNNEYFFELIPNVNGELYLSDEKVGRGDGQMPIIESPKSESALMGLLGAGKGTDAAGCAEWVYAGISLFAVYHFHDTSTTSPVRRDVSLDDYAELRPDGGNLAAFLHHLRQQEPSAYAQIRDLVRLVAPFFDDFVLDPERNGPLEQVRLVWRQKGSSTPMQPYQFSDGTIRFICLATALLQPSAPLLTVIDEPELGLHPFALEVVASLLRDASQRNKIIVSTQSPTLLDSFEPQDIIVVDRAEGASRFRRLEGGQLSNWLEDYSLGQLWRKNVIEGSPVHE